VPGRSQGEGDGPALRCPASVEAATDRYNEPIDYVAPNLPPNQLVVYTPNDNPASSGGDVLPTARQERAGRSTTATIAAALGSRDVLPLTAPVAQPTSSWSRSKRAASRAR
jgi:hypothetical protein